MPVVMDDWPDKEPTLASIAESWFDGRIYCFDVPDARGFGITQHDKERRPRLDEHVRDRYIMESMRNKLNGFARQLRGPYQTRSQISFDGKLLYFQFVGYQECRTKNCSRTAERDCRGHCELHGLVFENDD